MHKFIEFKNLSFTYLGGEYKVLDDINLEIEKGSFTLVAGPSGGGKSTFLKILNGIIPFTFKGDVQGDLLLEGESLIGKDAYDRCSFMGSVMQNADDQIIYEVVEDEVAFPLENTCVEPSLIKERIEHSLELMKLGADKKTATLSGGEKQRLITATTLAMRQKILLFDEPLANLDLKSSHELLGLLETYVREEGYTVIFIEHRLDWVLPYVDKVLWIENKSVREFVDKNEFNTFWNGNIYSNLCELDRQSVVTKEEILRLEGCSWKPRGKEVLHDIDFTLNKGEKWIVIGDNGSGKSSFIKLISTLEKRTDGDLSICYPKKDIFKNLGIVMQNPNYQLFMPSVKEEILLQAVNDEVGLKLISHFGLEPFMDKHPHSLSEGQKRKVGVASILAMQPTVLVFDEPTVGQDYKSLRLILEALEDFKKIKELTMVTITHDTRCAKYLGDKVIWLVQGSIYKVGGLELLDEFNSCELNVQPRANFDTK